MSDQRCERHGIYHGDWCPDCGPVGLPSAESKDAEIERLTARVKWLEDKDEASNQTIERLKRELARYENPGATHSEYCWSFGPRHYACAEAKIERLKRELDAYRWRRVEDGNKPETSGWYLFEYGPDDENREPMWAFYRIDRPDDETWLKATVYSFFGPIGPLPNAETEKTG